MRSRGINSARAATRRISLDVVNVRTERALTGAASILEVASANITPIDTSTLINSQYMIVDKGPKGWQARVGYTAEYAAALHRMKGKLMGQPRAHFGVTSDGKEFGGGTGVGNYWDPNAEPHFLSVAGADKQSLMFEVFVEEMKI